MSMDDGHDPDREAIMARRRRFIAMAIGGLATGCTPGKPTTTTTTNHTGTSTQDSSSSESGSSETGDESSSETGPSACLKLDLAAEPETGNDESDSGTETGTPRPCLVPPN